VEKKKKKKKWDYYDARAQAQAGRQVGRRTPLVIINHYHWHWHWPFVILPVPVYNIYNINMYVHFTNYALISHIVEVELRSCPS